MQYMVKKATERQNNISLENITGIFLRITLIEECDKFSMIKGGAYYI